MARTCGRASTYNNGGCRCSACKAAIAEYRANRRRNGKDRPNKGSVPAPEGESA